MVPDVKLVDQPANPRYNGYDSDEKIGSVDKSDFGVVPDVRPAEQPPDPVHSRLGRVMTTSVETQGGGGSNPPNEVKSANEIVPPKRLY